MHHPRYSVAGHAGRTRLRALWSLLAARRVTVSRLEATTIHPPVGETLDVEVEVSCSSGTYIRAIARM